jgi:hypothetical protein
MENEHLLVDDAADDHDDVDDLDGDDDDDGEGGVNGTDTAEAATTKASKVKKALNGDERRSLRLLQLSVAHAVGRVAALRVSVGRLRVERDANKASEAESGALRDKYARMQTELADHGAAQSAQRAVIVGVREELRQEREAAAATAAQLRYVARLILFFLRTFYVLSTYFLRLSTYFLRLSTFFLCFYVRVFGVAGV